MILWQTATYEVQRAITQNIYIQELWFLRSARWPVLVNIYIKFQDNTLNGLQTQTCKGFLFKVGSR